MLSKNQVREIRALHLKKYREGQKLFIAEGAKTITEIVTQRPSMIVTLYAQRSFLEKFGELIIQNNVRTIEVTEDELRSISLQTTPNLVLAVCRQVKNTDTNDTGQSFSFFLDDVRDPGNFGTIIRLCDWFGARQLFCSPDSCELYNPKVIQASMGAFLRVNVIYSKLSELVARKNFRNVYGAVLSGNNIFDEHVQPGLIVIGNEANGISSDNLRHVTRAITIPAHDANGSESLNAAMATAIIASEFFRQARSRSFSPYIAAKP